MRIRIGKQENSLDFDLHSLESLNPALKHEKSSIADPDSIGSLDPDLDSQSGSRSRRVKITHKNRKNLNKFHLEVQVVLF